MNSQDMKKLRHWFLSQRRDLPWREEPTPYAVWVSEVMLQQTQVAVVIPYFLRWMQRFPTIEALANAPVEAVLKEWEGLGYYSRARNLHQGARYVMEHHAGVLPSTVDELKAIKGLGDYTVGAILSFAFHQRKAAVDGNVLRVLARYYCIDEDIGLGKVQKKMRVLAEELLPKEEPWIISEALIELGATVCMRKAKCMECPLNGHCQAHIKDQTDRIPVKGAQAAVTALYRLVPVISCGDRLLVRCGEPGKVMADLFQFPYFEITHADYDTTEQKELMKREMKKEFSLSTIWKKELPQVKHSFTRYRACLMPHMYAAKEAKIVPGFEWISIDELRQVPFSSGHRRIFAMAFETGLPKPC
jgi:A/G-specific adenine glycosylase